ncbi:hypothetical protein LZ31DRAFT_227560 [Colletotrichum somersetense]|nr:hypothetical protein LZ31DRAFT_227560 [Colletotrichum somersetense]
MARRQFHSRSGIVDTRGCKEGGCLPAPPPLAPPQIRQHGMVSTEGVRDFLLADERQKHTDRQGATAHPRNGRNDDSWRLKGQKPGPCRRDERYPSVSGLLGQGVWGQQPVARQRCGAPWARCPNSSPNGRLGAGDGVVCSADASGSEGGRNHHLS